MGIKNVHLMAIGMLNEAAVNKGDPATGLEPSPDIKANGDE